MSQLTLDTTEIEKIILGSLLTNNDVLHTYIVLLDGAFFNDEKHVHIFYGLKYLYIASTPIDRFTLSNHLREHASANEDWAILIDELISQAVNTRLLKGYIDHFVAAKIEAELGHISHTLIRFNTPLQVRIAEAINKLYALQHYLHADTVKPIRDAILHWKQNLGNELVYLRTPYAVLNRTLTGGFLRGELNIIGARPSMGKTEFAINLMHHYATTQQLKCTFLSMRTRADLFGKMLFTCANKNKNELVTLKNISNLEKLGLINYQYFKDGNIDVLLAQMAYLKTTTGLDMVFIDTLQLLNLGKEDMDATKRDTMIGMVLKKIKDMAINLNVVVFCLSELSRNTEKRRLHNRPMLGDLRHSGFIEEMADKIMVLYSPEYYNLKEWEDGMLAQGRGEIMLLKNRTGAITSARINYNVQQMIFEDFTE